jgi:hypothetical protein
VNSCSWLQANSCNPAHDAALYNRESPVRVQQASNSLVAHWRKTLIAGAAHRTGPVCRGSPVRVEAASQLDLSALSGRSSCDDG